MSDKKVKVPPEQVLRDELEDELEVPEDELEVPEDESMLPVDEEGSKESEPEDPPVEVTNAEIRIVDDNGHLLFMFNPTTNSIEIKVPVGRSSDKGKKFSIDVEKLLHLGARNWLVADRVSRIEAKRIDNG